MYYSIPRSNVDTLHMTNSKLHNHKVHAIYIIYYTLNTQYRIVLVFYCNCILYPLYKIFKIE